MAALIPRSILVAAGTALAGCTLAVQQCLLDDASRNTATVGSYRWRTPFRSGLLNTALAAYTVDFKPSVAWDKNWDHREPASMVRARQPTESEEHYEKRLAAAKPTAVRHILLVRHGQYEVNARNAEDRVLTALGHEQAHFTGQRLASMGLPLTRLVHSTMVRASETAADILSELPVTPPVEACDLLPEGQPVAPEPPIPNYAPSAETFHEDGARIEAAFRRYFHRAKPEQSENSYEVVVCHANVIRYIMCRALQFPPEAWLRFNLDHGSLTWITIMPSGRVALRTLGNSGHIPAGKISY